MPNGSQCCALEICCPPGADTRKKVAQKIADATSTKPDDAALFLDWMDANGLTFAPKSFAAVIQELADITRKHGG